jgi:hypothetical protein
MRRLIEFKCQFNHKWPRTLADVHSLLVSLEGKTSGMTYRALSYSFIGSSFAYILA